ncbi:MAG: hypothetical protein ACOCVF_03785 [bacterium]
MDARIEFIMDEYRRNDKSFQEKESAFELMLRPFGKKFTKQEMRENWHMGIRHGIEIGFHKASLEVQRLELYNNIKDPKHKEFLDKFYALAAEYKCAIQYHPQHGMIVGSLNICNF